MELWNEHVEKNVIEGHRCKISNVLVDDWNNTKSLTSTDETDYTVSASLCLIMTEVHLYLYYGKVITSSRYISSLILFRNQPSFHTHASVYFS